MSTPQSTPARILIVCTGNICRSVYAERILAMYFRPEEVHVASAGLGAVVGHDIEATVRGLLPERALRQPHAARQIEPPMIAEADIVLALTREHRAEVAAMLPAAVRKVFTLREAARLIMTADAVPAFASPRDAFRALAEWLTVQRGQGAPTVATDDVSDPFRRGDAAFAAMKAEMDPACAVLVRFAWGQLPSQEGTSPAPQPATGPGRAPATPPPPMHRPVSGYPAPPVRPGTSPTAAPTDARR